MAPKHDEDRLPRDSSPRVSLEEALRMLASGQSDQESDKDQRDRDESAFRQICEAAHRSRLKLLGEKPNKRPDEPRGQHEVIPWGLFGPGAPGEPHFSFPDLDDETTEPPLAIVWEKAGTIKLTWKNVQIDRYSFEQWLEPTTSDPALFDPMQETDWTLAMAVAWLRWGSADAVREQWDIWLDQCFDWQKHGDHWNLVRRRQASLEWLIEDAAENRTAWNTLKQALVDGRISGTGIRTNSEEKSALPIPAAEWRRLVNHPTGPDLVEKFRYPYTSTSPGHGYDEILVASADVQGLWPARPTQPTAETEGDPPTNLKRRPGPRPKYEDVWNDTLKPMALEIYAEIGPYDRNADALQKDHISQIIARFTREHPTKKCPSAPWFKPRLRAIQKQLDDYLDRRNASDGWR